jgi:dTDP-4-dehydrorhamnose reductase
MDYLITGALGQLGRAVISAAGTRGAASLGSDLPEVAVDDRASVRQWILQGQPRYVIHCAAYTDVDGCERDPDQAQRVNGQGTAHVVAACREAGIGLVYISTDFVFDGEGQTPYREDHPVAPLSEYGRSKLLGEDAVLESADPRFFVVRTSWVFGPGGRHFPAAILARARSGEPLRVVDDQVGSPTMTLDLAEAILDLVESGAPGGIYHAANAGHCSWHRFAIEVLAAAGLEQVAVEPMSSDELARPAPRPAWSVLDCAKLAAIRGGPLPDYGDALRRYLEEEVP